MNIAGLHITKKNNPEVQIKDTYGFWHYSKEDPTVGEWVKEFSIDEFTGEIVTISMTSASDSALRVSDPFNAMKIGKELIRAGIPVVLKHAHTTVVITTRTIDPNGY